MNADLDIRMEQLQEELRQLEKQKELQQEQQQKEQISAGQSEESGQGEEYQEAKNRLTELIRMSEDPYYDQYIRQMMADLKSGKATPKQILREADRTFLLYKQRMNAQLSPNPAVSSASGKESGHRMEFKIGASVLGVAGALLIIFSLVSFGMNYLTGFLQGMLLYAVSLALMLCSELLLKRFSSQFSLIITGLGICSLYVSTIVNYLYLHNFNVITAMLLLLIIVSVSLLISRRKDSVYLKIISVLGCYICFVPVIEITGNIDFLVITIILFIVNLANVYLPVSKHGQVINQIHMGVNTIFAIILSLAGIGYQVDSIYIILYLVTTIIILNLAYIRQEENITNFLLYGVELACSILLLLLLSVGEIRAFRGQSYILFDQYLMIGLLCAVCIFFMVFSQNEKIKWLQYNFFIAAALLTFLPDKNITIKLLGVLILFVISKIPEDRKEVEVINAIVALSALGLLAYATPRIWQIHGTAPTVIAAMLAIAMLASAWKITRWQLYYECVITISLLAAFPYTKNSDINTLINICILFGTMLLFNHLPRLCRHRQEMIAHGRFNQQKFYNAANICLLLLLSLSVFQFRSSILASGILVLGALAIILFLSNRYYLGFAGKYLILAVYLVVMILFIPYHNAAVTNILLSLTAVACVVFGIRQNDRPLRLCGLVLALSVCFKFMLFDIRNMEYFKKTLVSFVVGVIILIISFIYIRLEKQEGKKAEEAKPDMAGTESERVLETVVESEQTAGKSDDVESPELIVKEEVSEESENEPW